MKSPSYIATLAAMTFAVSAYAQLPPVTPQPPPKGTVAQSMDDSAISAKVLESITSDPLLKDVELTVDTTDGVVTLNGTATAKDQVARAVAIAKAVPGVKSVTNILAVKTS